MDYFFWGLIAILAFYSIKNAETKKLKKIYVGIYGTILIIGLAYMSGELTGETIYYLTHKNS